MRWPLWLSLSSPWSPSLPPRLSSWGSPSPGAGLTLPSRMTFSEVQAPPPSIHPYPGDLEPLLRLDLQLLTFQVSFLTSSHSYEPSLFPTPSPQHGSSPHPIYPDNSGLLRTLPSGWSLKPTQTVVKLRSQAGLLLLCEHLRPV